MSRINKLIAVAISPILLFVVLVTCTKEYSYEGGPPAVYDLVGSPGECVGSVLYGSYFTGVPADAGDSLQVLVHVSVTGNFNIYTASVNGIQFSASGNFADTGTISVTLSCSGTPDSAGTYTVQIPGTNGCFFNLAVEKQPPSSYYLSGNPNDCQNPVINGPYIAGQAFRADNTIDVTVLVNSPGNYTIETDTLDGMSFAASGYFLSTGSQTVTLKGDGTPTNAGLIFFTLYSDSSICHFSLPVQNADPLAVYVLESAVGDTTDVCTPHIVQGIYTTGVPLNNTNTVTIGVYVKNTGNYSISTEIIDGIVFSFTGTFTSTGEQNVTLYGSGTPETRGTLNFTPKIIGPTPLGGGTCSFTIMVQ